MVHVTNQQMVIYALKILCFFRRSSGSGVELLTTRNINKANRIKFRMNIFFHKSTLPSFEPRICFVYNIQTTSPAYNFAVWMSIFRVLIEDATFIGGFIIHRQRLPSTRFLHMSAFILYCQILKKSTFR